jgi:hypothetical protein
MPPQTRGTVYPVKGGVGIRWQHHGARHSNPGPFRNKTEARKWFDEHAAPRMRRGQPAADITFDRFCDDYLDRCGALSLASELILAVRGDWRS